MKRPTSRCGDLHKADVVIIGGGYIGLSSAYNIQRRLPDKKIMLFAGAIPS